MNECATKQADAETSSSSAQKNDSIYPLIPPLERLDSLPCYAETPFLGVSLWVELGGLIPSVIAKQSEYFGTHCHAPHMTILYNIRPGWRDEKERGEERSTGQQKSQRRLTYQDVQYCETLFEAFKERFHTNKILGKRKKNNTQQSTTEAIALQPKHLSYGRSSLFPHAYVDMFFEASPWLAELYRLAMEVFDFYENEKSFAGAPHGCLGYARTGSTAGMAFDDSSDNDDRIDKKLLEWFPALMAQPVPVLSIGLWSTQGQTTQWSRITPLSQQIRFDSMTTS